MSISEWSVGIVNALQELWNGVLGFVPSLIGALIILIFGLIVAAVIAALIERIFDSIKLDNFLKSIGLTPYFERAGLKLRGARFLGRLVYWFLIIAFILAATDALGLSALSSFLESVLFYIPNVVVAVLIMLAAVIVANFLRKLVGASIKSAKLHAANFLGTLTWWAVILFGLFAALSQLNVASDIVTSLATGLIAMLALAGGLAFGLGGKEYAASLINKLKQHTE
jgi:hypothetical protein